MINSIVWESERERRRYLVKGFFAAVCVFAGWFVALLGWILMWW